jgi:hypothetical protein
VALCVLNRAWVGAPALVCGVVQFGEEGLELEVDEVSNPG